MPDAPPLTPTTATVDLGALRHNARLIQQRAAPAKLMAVVKADAYGHGAVRVAQTLQDEGVQQFAVARVPEAIELREAGIERNIQVFEAPLPDHLPAYVRHHLGVTVSSEAVAEALIEAARGCSVPVRAHVKVETGMNRIGVPVEAAPGLVHRLVRAGGVEVAGLWTHFAAADRPDEEDFTRHQFTLLQEAADAAGPIAGRVHAANTPALLHFADSFRRLKPTFVRCGLALYGLTSFPSEARAALGADLRPVMRLTSKVTHVKTVEAGATVSYDRTWTAPERVRLATVGCGYGDGYTRLLSNRAQVGIGGARFPVVGNVCMDLFMVNLGPADAAPPVQAGDEVVLFGEGGPSTQKVADWSETITYETTTRVMPRVPRIYVSQDAPAAAETADSVENGRTG